MVEIEVNGVCSEVDDGERLLSFLERLGHDPRCVAIELNGDVLRRSKFEEIVLGADDRLEIVRFVQGGAQFVNGEYAD